MMKNIKRLVLGVMLIGSVAVVLASCAFKLNSDQEVLYNNYLKGVEELAAKTEISADAVKQGLEGANNTFKVKGFKVVDKDAGKPIAQGTKVDVLKKRFVPEKA